MSELPYDPAAALAHLQAQDPQLAGLIARVGPLTLAPAAMHSPFESLLEAIAHQQLNARAAGTILGRVRGLFGDRYPTPQELAATEVTALRAAGLSQAKAAAMRDLAARTLQGLVPTLAELEDLSDAAIVERLTAVRGIGPWTVEMLLIFRLGRPDVWPTTDYGVRQGFARLRGLVELPTPRELAAHGEPWRPFRSVAAWYLWRILELPQDEAS